MERIRLPKEGRDVVRILKMTEQEYHRWKELFYKKEEKFFEMLAGEQEKEGLLLSLYVRFATDLYKAYVENGHIKKEEVLLLSLCGKRNTG